MRRIALSLIFLTCFLTIARAADAPVLLPTGWGIAPPDGASATVGTLPTGLALSRDEQRLAVVESGFGPAGLRIVDAATLATQRFIPLSGAYGTPLRDRDGDGLWVAGANADAIFHVDPATGSVDRTVALKGYYPVAIARSADGALLAVSGESANRVALLDAASGSVTAEIPAGPHPSALLFSSDGRSLFVAAWGARSVDVIDVAARALRARIAVGDHPEALALSPDGAVLYVANADDDSISAIETATARLTRTIPLHLWKDGLVGASPNALALSPDGSRLYVSCGAANAVAVLRTNAGANVIGAIPTGWYPTAVAFSGNDLIVADAKGEGGHANPELDPIAHGPSSAGYVARNLLGSLRRMPVPLDAQLAGGLASVRRLDRSALPGEGANPVLSPRGPIKHVIYVIKENRSYDQVLGDARGGDGDPRLLLFGEKVTPNQHALAARFGLFDRFFTNSHVSADGHNWTDASFANDYVEKMWPPQYAGRRKPYDFEDAQAPGTPHSGYIWDDARRSRVSFRNYGEFESFKGPPWKATSPELAEVTDDRYPNFDLKIDDRTRIVEWAREFEAFERNGNLPQLELVRLPNDHTAGTAPGMLTPTAFVAQNDDAVGRLVGIVSHSRYWKSTAIFLLEDDAQNGPDHVDEQRSTLYIASPYATGGVHHERYTTASVVRTIELILGMPPLNAYDGGARPLGSAFRATPDLTAYTPRPPQADLSARNTAASYHAARSARLDFSKEDDVPDAVLNDIVWHAVRGARATPPPYGAF